MPPPWGFSDALAQNVHSAFQGTVSTNWERSRVNAPEAILDLAFVTGHTHPERGIES